MSLGSELVGYLGGLTLTGGDRDGEPFTVLGWERRFVLGAFRRSGDAALSVARGNGKSAVCAGLATAVVDPGGPLHRPRAEVIAVAASFEQGRVIFEDVLGFVKGLGHDVEDRKVWRKQDSANRAWLEHRPSGARVRCLGANPNTMHGLRPLLVLADEPAQWEPGLRDRALAALKTGLGKVPGSRLIALGTRPAAEGHWFAKMLEGGADYAQTHAADPLDPPFRVATWRRANPSLDHLPSLLAKLREEAADAKRDPAALAAFRALRLNLGTDDTEASVLIEAERWEALAAEPAEATGQPLWGVDLGGTAASSAVAAYWPETGLLRAVAAFPSEPPLGERGLRDGVGRLYVDCARRGELLELGGAAVNVSTLIHEAVHRFGRPRAVACDRWRSGEMIDAMRAAGLRSVPVDWRGMGYMDGGEDVRAFRRACLEERVRPERNLFLASAVASARTTMDPAGNSKLAKGSEGGRRVRARDDAAAAAILAVGLAERMPKPRAGAYIGVVG